MSWPCSHSEGPVRRHDLVFVGSAGWRAMLAGRADLAAEPLVRSWSDRGWPTIRRRALPGDARGVALGLPLPPFVGKKRLCFVLQSADIMSIARPPLLSSVYAAAPAAWMSTLDRLADLASRHSVDARIYGSLAWQALTGLAYVTERSDLDLLLDIRSDSDLDRLATDLAAIEAEAPMRLDGELMRQDGAAVNWREFHSGIGELLVKGIETVGLLERRRFIAGEASC